MDPARELLQLRYRVGQPGRDPRQVRPQVIPAGGDVGRRGARGQPERDQPLLGAVMQVALDPAAGLTDRVEALGGSIRLDSAAGAGTRITVDLPIELRAGLGPAR